MLVEDCEIDYQKLSAYEQTFVDKDGFWNEYERQNRMFKVMDGRANRDTGEPKEVIPIEINSWEVFVPGANTILSEYMDIASLFSTQAKMGKFLDFMFSYSLNNDIEGLSPFYFHESKGGGGSYVFDYSYIIYMIIEWSVVELEAERDKMMRFMKFFTAGTRKDYLRSNHFLIQGVFGFHQILASTFAHPSKIKNVKMIRKAYCNPVIIKSHEDEDLFFLSVPFWSNVLLKFCSEDVIMELLKVRNSLNIRQYKWGKDVNEHRTAHSFFRLEFPD